MILTESNLQSAIVTGSMMRLADAVSGNEYLITIMKVADVVQVVLTGDVCVEESSWAVMIVYGGGAGGIGGGLINKGY